MQTLAEMERKYMLRTLEATGRWQNPCHKNSQNFSYDHSQKNILKHTVTSKVTDQLPLNWSIIDRLFALALLFGFLYQHYLIYLFYRYYIMLPLLQLQLALVLLYLKLITGNSVKFEGLPKLLWRRYSLI